MTFKPKKLFTPEEANNALPLVRKITADIAETYRRLMENSELAGSPNPDEIRGLDSAHREELGDIFERIEQDKKLFEEYVEELDRLGILLKGPLDGLIDFPALRDGKIVLLCWRTGEDAVSFWHGLDDGFRGRQPIRPEEFVAVEKPVLADKAIPKRTTDSEFRKDKKWNSSRSS